jgi:hypothetical protein
MLDDAKVDAPTPGELWADSEPPQLPQNLKEELFSTPHCGHFADNAAPHPPQNLFPAGFSVAHFEQRISALPHARRYGPMDARSGSTIRKSTVALAVNQKRRRNRFSLGEDYFGI